MFGSEILEQLRRLSRFTLFYQSIGQKFYGMRYGKRCVRRDTLI